MGLAPTTPIETAWADSCYVAALFRRVASPSYILSLIQFAGVTILLIVAMIVSTGSWSPRLIPRVIILLAIMAGAVLLNVKILAKSPQANMIGRPTR